MQRDSDGGLGVLHEIRFVEGHSRWADRVRFLRTLYPNVAFSEAREVAEHAGQQVIAAGLAPHVAADLVAAWRERIACVAVETPTHSDPALGGYPVGLYDQSPHLDAIEVQALRDIRASCHSEADSPLIVRDEICLRLAVETRRGVRATMSLKPSMGVRVRRALPDRSVASTYVAPLERPVAETLYFELAERIHGWSLRLPEGAWGEDALHVNTHDRTSQDMVFWEFLSPFGCRVSRWSSEGEELIEMISEQRPQDWVALFRT